MTLSLKAWGALQYLVNTNGEVSAKALSKAFSDGRDGSRVAMKELREQGYVLTRHENVNGKVQTVTYVTQKGFQLVSNPWGRKSRPLIQPIEQNSHITQYANSAIIFYESTNEVREGGLKMGYEFFDKTSSEDDEVRNERAKAQADKKAEYQSLKEADQKKRFTERKNRQPKDWSCTDVAFEFSNRVHKIWHIKPWQVTRTRFTQALGQNRKKFDTDGQVELEMMNLFFASMDFSKYEDADALWKIFISRYSELAAQARVRINTPDDLATAKVQAEDSWKGL